MEDIELETDVMKSLVQKTTEQRNRDVAEKLLEAKEAGKDYVDLLILNEPTTFPVEDPEVFIPTFKTRYNVVITDEKRRYPERYEVRRYHAHELTAEDAEKLRDELDDEQGTDNED